jgi:hypothetical protein
MSLSSASSYRSPYGSAVLQHGVLTFVATETCTVPCSSIAATDNVYVQVATPTAGTVPAAGTQLTNNLFTIVITPGTGFTCVSKDAAFAGTVDYIVLASGLASVSVNSA